MAEKKKSIYSRKLKDVNKDGKRNFADTWLGDLIGADGKAGVQKDKLKSSLKGSRRESGMKDTAKTTATKKSTRTKTRANAEAPTATKVTTPKVTTRTLSPAGTSGRGDGAKEVERRRTDALIDMADKAIKKSPKAYSYKEWKDMSRAERKAAGLPVSVIGGELGFKRFKTGVTGKDYKMTPGAAKEEKTSSPGSRGRNRGRTGAAKGGMAKKSAYKKGGMVKANCGASMKPNGRAKK